MTPETATGGNDPRDPRIYLAAERTFLAWLRTGLSLMGFGFVIARFGWLIRVTLQVPASENSWRPSLVLGSLLLIMGVAVCLYGAFRFDSHLAAIDRGDFRSKFSSRFAWMLSISLLVIGLSALLALLFAPG